MSHEEMIHVYCLYLYFYFCKPVYTKLSANSWDGNYKDEVSDDPD